MPLEVYEGAEPTSAVSARFLVRVRHEGHRVRLPHVYETRSPDDLLNKIHANKFCRMHGGCLCNRSMAWAEFGQRADEVAYVKVTRRDGLTFPQSTRILPRSAAVRIDAIADGGRTLLFAVRGTPGEAARKARRAAMASSAAAASGA